MATKISLETLDARFTKLENIIEKGFAAVAEDISKLATKEDVSVLGTQVNSIERQLRDMKHVKLEDRVADLEQKIFGEVRA